MPLLSVPLNFVTGFKLKLIHIPLIKSIRSIFIHLWFSLVCRAVIAHRNKFFLWYLHNRSAVSKANFKQPNNRCKMYPELVKRLYAIPSFLKDSILVTFGILEILFSTKVHIIIQMTFEAMHTASDKAKVPSLETQMLMSRELSTSSFF